MHNTLVGRHVSWTVVGKNGDERRTGTVLALAYSHQAEDWFALIEPDDGSEFADVYATKLRKAPR